MLIIPLAYDNSGDDGAYFKEKAVALGFSEDKVFAFDERKPEAIPDIFFDYIYVPGGNTFVLLHNVKKFGLDKLIKENYARGCVYIGASAGAYIACPDIENVSLFDTDSKHEADHTALGLTDKYVLCHYDQNRREKRKIYQQNIGNKELMVLTDEDIIEI